MKRQGGSTSVIMDRARRYLNARTTRSTRRLFRMRKVLSDRRAETPDAAPEKMVSTTEIATTAASKTLENEEQYSATPIATSLRATSTKKSQVKTELARSSSRARCADMLADSMASTIELTTMAAMKKLLYALLSVMPRSQRRKLWIERQRGDCGSSLCRSR